MKKFIKYSSTKSYKPYLATTTLLKLAGVIAMNILVVSYGYAQKYKSNETHNICGNIELSDQQRQEVAQQFMVWQAKGQNNKSGSVKYTIPVVFHLIEKSPSMNNNNINQAITQLNTAFAHSGAFNLSPLGVDTEIEFCLAQEAPDGSKTFGINRITSDYNRMDMDLEDAKLKTMLQWDPRYYLNIWVVDQIYSEIIHDYTGRKWWTRLPAAAYATLPAGIIGKDHFTDGIVTTTLDAEVLVHECGHYLGLLHTFYGGCKNDNCLQDGDMVCDTPPDKSFIKSSCPDNTCGTDTLSNYSNNVFFEDVPDMGTNFMDYNGCPSDFSVGQRDRMHFFLEQSRNELYIENPNGNYVCTPPCDSNISISFEQSILKPILTDTVDFVSQSSGITDHEWYVEYLVGIEANYSIAIVKGYTPSNKPVAITPNLSYNFPDIGKYRVYLKAWNISDTTCFTSYSKIVRVTCGVDARYLPDKRFIAAKRPISRFLEPVIFTNNSTGADEYEWKITHQNPIDGLPNLPDYISKDIDLTYTFPEPGDYKISLKATNGGCIDIANTFNLEVVDPTIDGIPQIISTRCYHQDSLLVKVGIDNIGYDTINVGTPISFYKINPLNNSSELIQSFELSDVIFGFEREEFIFMINNKPPLESLFVAFNDVGTTDFPLVFPKDDNNIMSFNASYPVSGYPELTYINNIASILISDEKKRISDIWACDNQLLEFKVEEELRSIEWLSSNNGIMGYTNPITYSLIENDTIDVSWKTDYSCTGEERFLVGISYPILELSDTLILIQKGQSVQLKAAGGIGYKWSPEIGLSDPNISNPIASPVEPLTYTVEVMDSIGCAVTGSIQIELITDAYIPDLFTPNNDFNNDYLKVYGLENVAEIDLKIFNRNGNLVFENSESNYLNSIGWDGTWKGKEQPDGIYYWKVSGEYTNGLPITLNGHEKGAIHLIR